MRPTPSSLAHAAHRYWLGLLSPTRGRLTPGRDEFGTGERTPGLHDLDREGDVDSDGIRIHHYGTGPLDAAHTVVFVHGFGLNAHSFFRQIDHLRAHHGNLRCVLLDLRGHGQSQSVPAERCSVAGAADDVRAVLDHCVPTGPLILVGHSLGGPVLFNLIRRCPEQLRKRITGLVIIGSSTDAFAEHGIPQLLATPAADQLHHLADRAPGPAERLRRAITPRLAPALAVSIYRRPTDYTLIRFHALMFRGTPLETYMGFFSELQNHDESAAGEKLSGIPGYALLGELDDVTPEEHFTQLHRVWPEAWLQVGQSAGHMLPLEFPELVNAAIDRLLERAA